MDKYQGLISQPGRLLRFHHPGCWLSLGQLPESVLLPASCRHIRVTFRATGRKHSQETTDVPVALSGQTNDACSRTWARNAHNPCIPALRQLAFHAVAQLELQTMIPDGEKTFWAFLNWIL